MLEFTQKHKNLAPLIKSNPLFYTFAKHLDHLFPERHSCLIQYCSDNLGTIEELISFKNHTNITSIRIYLPFDLFNAVFPKSHSHSHSGEKPSISSFIRFYYIPHIPLWFSFFNLDCLDCQKMNTSLPDKKLLHTSHFMKTLLISITGSRWIQKVHYLLPQMKIKVFCRNWCSSASLI